MRSFIFDANRKPMAPDDYRDAQMALLADGMPKDMAGGMSAVAKALMLRNRRGPFPSAPGGNTAGSLMTGLFGLGGKGGLS